MNPAGFAHLENSSLIQVDSSLRSVAIPDVARVVDTIGNDVDVIVVSVLVAYDDLRAVSPETDFGKQRGANVVPSPVRQPLPGRARQRAMPSRGSFRAFAFQVAANFEAIWQGLLPATFPPATSKPSAWSHR
jgi:hypothetical protein